MLSEIIEARMSGKTDQALAMMCQMHKILVQDSIDNGAWESGMLLWSSPDPLLTERNEKGASVPQGTGRTSHQGEGWRRPAGRRG